MQTNPFWTLLEYRTDTEFYNFMWYSKFRAGFALRPSGPYIRLASISSFCRMNWQGVFILPSGWAGCHAMGCHGRVDPTIKFAVAHLYIWVERGSMRVKYVLPENTRQCPWSGLEPRPLDPETIRTNLEATACPPAVFACLSRMVPTFCSEYTFCASRKACFKCGNIFSLHEYKS